MMTQANDGAVENITRTKSTNYKNLYIQFIIIQYINIHIYAVKDSYIRQSTLYPCNKFKFSKSKTR